MRCTRRTCAVGLVVCFVLAGNSVGGGFTSGRVSPCGSSNANETWPWCNFSAPISQRVAALVDALLPAEKAGLLRNVASAVPRLGLPTYDWWNEAVHGFARVQVINQTDGSTHDVHVNATSFPMSIGMAAAFNRTLWSEVGGVIGREARGAANADLYGTNALTFWAPNINIARDSRWGRNQETPGEDPFTNGEYAQSLISGMQGSHPTWLQISACAKHFAVHSWNTPSMYMALVSQQDLADTYLPAFETAVKSGVSGFMCAYNGVNGYPGCANQDLLAEVRSRWGFDGYITSDCGAVGTEWYGKHVPSWGSTEDVILQSLSAGMDSDCGGSPFDQKTLLQYMESTPAIASAVDVALTNLFKVQMRLGMFDPPDTQPPWAKYGAEQINTAENRAVVLEAAQQGLVLLQNKGGVLPLRAASIKQLALVGPNVQNIVTHDCGPRKEPSYLGCEGCYCGNAIDPVSPLDGFAMHVGSDNIAFAPGCTDIMCNRSASGAMWTAAVAAATSADATVVIAGLDVTQECEGVDRTSVSMPGAQDGFISDVCAAVVGGSRRRGQDAAPCVVLIMSGSAVDTEAIEANPNVSAVMWVGYPGERGGEAIANAVFGAVDSFGKLPFSVYKAAYYQNGGPPSENISPLDFSMRPNASSHNPGRTYRFYHGPLMLHPFGTGLQYNQWHLDAATLSMSWRGVASGSAAALSMRDIATADDDVSVMNVSVRAWHTGTFATSSVVVMAFAVPPGAGVDGKPLRTLVGFERVNAAASTADGMGGGVTVSFQLPKRAVMLADEEGNWKGEAGMWSIVIEAGPTYSASHTFSVVS